MDTNQIELSLIFLNNVHAIIRSRMRVNILVGKDDLFEKIYHDKRRILKVEPDVDVADLLAAREDLAIIEKTSSVSVRRNTKSALNKVIIGTVSKF